MALQNGNFRGKFDGKDLYYYKSQIDYKIDNMDERIDLIKRIFGIECEDNVQFTNELFWKEVWDTGICKSEINTTDVPWNETNVAMFLEQVGTYLLALDGDEEEKSLDSKDIERKEKLEVRTKIRMEDAETYTGNYKLKPRYKFENKDLKKYPQLKDYVDYKCYLSSLKDNPELTKAISDKIKDPRYTPEKIWYHALSTMAEVSDDLTRYKMSIERPIVFKSPLKDEGCPEWDELDMFQPAHVLELLKVHKGNDLQDDLSCMVMDLNNIINEIEFTETQKEVLELYRRDKSLIDIADIIDVSPQTIKGHITSIVNAIIKEYEKRYTDWYYLNKVKGTYKKCTKCGKVKLITEFSTSGKNRLQSQCKNCRRG